MSIKIHLVNSSQSPEQVNRPFPSYPGPLFQNEGRCSAFDMEIIFHSHTNETHFHNKSCAPSLILKVRVFGTRKWPIRLFCRECYYKGIIFGYENGVMWCVITLHVLPF